MTIIAIIECDAVFTIAIFPHQRRLFKMQRSQRLIEVNRPALSIFISTPLHNRGKYFCFILFLFDAVSRTRTVKTQSEGVAIFFFAQVEISRPPASRVFRVA